MTARSTILALLLATSVPAQPSAPDTLPGKVFTAWLTAFNSGDRERIRSFDETYRREPPPIEQTLNFRENTGGFELIRVEKSDETTLVALVKEQSAASRTTATSGARSFSRPAWRPPTRFPKPRHSPIVRRGT